MAACLPLRHGQMNGLKFGEISTGFCPAAAQVLKAFLTARQTYIMQCLSAATRAGADTDLDSLAVILADVATLVGGVLSGVCVFVCRRGGVAVLRAC